MAKSKPARLAIVHLKTDQLLNLREKKALQNKKPPNPNPRLIAGVLAWRFTLRKNINLIYNYMNTQLNIENFDFTAFSNYVDKHEVIRCIQDKSFDFDPDDFDNFKEQIQDYFQENDLLDQDIIYYANAIEFLKKHDPSLQQSIELAKEHGYTIENINSELLASLLATSHAREEFNDFLASDTLQEIFDFLVLENLEQELEKIENERVELNHKIEELKAEIHARKNPVLEA